MIYKHKLYNGEETVVFDEFKHEYVNKDSQIISVTQVNDIVHKPALQRWAVNQTIKKVSEKILVGKKYNELELLSIWEEARKEYYEEFTRKGRRGSFIHNWLDDHARKKNPQMPESEDLQKAINQILTWEKEYEVETLLSEIIVYSRKHNYVGTLDRICKINNCKAPGLYIVDFKTGSGIWNEYWLQTAAYLYARNEEFPEEEYQGQMIVRPMEEGRVEVAINRDKEMYKKMMIGFLAAKKLSETIIGVSNFRPERQ